MGCQEEMNQNVVFVRVNVRSVKDGLSCSYHCSKASQQIQLGTFWDFCRYSRRYGVVVCQGVLTSSSNLCVLYTV